MVVIVIYAPVAKEAMSRSGGHLDSTFYAEQVEIHSVDQLLKILIRLDCLTSKLTYLSR